MSDLRCRAGDMAFMVSGFNGFTGNLGRVVEVVRYYGEAHYKSGEVGYDCWLVVGNLVMQSGRPFCAFSRKLGVDGCIPDKFLRPIRPGEGADEMLLIAGKPAEVTA